MMFTTRIGRIVALVLLVSFGLFASGCAVVRDGATPVAGAMTSGNVPVYEARKALKPVTGVVVYVAPATLTDASETARHRAAGSTVGGLFAYALVKGMKSSNAGVMLGTVLGVAAGDALGRRSSPEVRSAEQVVVRIDGGKQVAVIQEIDAANPELRLGEAVIVVYGPQTTRVVRQSIAGRTAVQPMPQGID